MTAEKNGGKYTINFLKQVVVLPCESWMFSYDWMHRWSTFWYCAKQVLSHNVW